jgi:hypothetical protein
MNNGMLTDLEIQPGAATAIVRDGQLAIRVLLRWDKKQGIRSRFAIIRLLFQHADKEFARQSMRSVVTR